MKKILIILSTLILSLACFAFILSAYIYNYGTNFNEKIPLNIEVTHKELKTIKAVGKGLYESDGKYIQLKGVNFGN